MAATSAYASGKPATVPAPPVVTVPPVEGGPIIGGPPTPVPAEEDRYPAGCRKRYENDRKVPQAPFASPRPCN
jgi:hypothetical protein